MESTLLGFLLLLIGSLYLVRSDLIVRYHIWTQRFFMGAKYIPSQRTYTLIRFMGALFIFLGFLVIVGILQ